MEKHVIRNKAIKAVEETTFYPPKGKERLMSMIEDRPDWCISRQRSWGVPLPIFINKKTKKPLHVKGFLKVGVTGKEQTTR